MSIITASIGKHHFETIIKSETNSIISDEPLSSGGTNKGFSPHELLSSSLASCTCITLRMYADRKQWELEDILVKVEVINDSKQNILHIDLKIEFWGNLSSEQKKRFLEIAHHCPIHKALINSIQINTLLK